MPSAAALVIGNELLTGKIREANVEVLARELFALGIALRRVVFCPDEVAAIVADLDSLRHSHDWVFTSGGVGPTHDDVTLEAVALAFGRPLLRSAEVEGLLRGYFGARLGEEHLRMADLPQGAELVKAPGAIWPLVLVGNVFVLPGLPEVFRYKMPILRSRLGGGRPFVSRSLTLQLDEGQIAAPLRQVAADFPAVRIGSYPKGLEPGAPLVLTFDGREEILVENAMAAFRAAFPELSSSAVPLPFPSPSRD
jgi:molybdopterin-biosynthesis enzyme MoeA-like protein